jgi:hypothetical protein
VSDHMQKYEAGLKYREALLRETREELQKADAKASILLAATGIAFSTLLTALGAGTWSPNKMQHEDARLLIWVSIFLGVLGIVLLGSAVKPRLRAKAMGPEKLHYFGNVRSYWPSAWFIRNRKSRYHECRDAFDVALRRAATEENYLSRLNDQIWFLGRTAFRKYRLITFSLWTFALAIGLAIIGLLLEKY